jgi:hypothetical protein
MARGGSATAAAVALAHTVAATTIVRIDARGPIMIAASSLRDSRMTQPWKPWTLRMLRRAAAFVVAAFAMVVLGSASSSYFVQRAWSGAAGLADAGAPAAMPFADRISWAMHDLFGMFALYCPLTAIALLVAFLIAGALARFTGLRMFIFGLAGAVALFALFTILRNVLGTVGVFGARGPAALAGQMLVGAIAGMLFARLTAPGK